MQSEAEPKATGVQIAEDRGLEDSLHETVKRLQSEQRRKTFWKLLAVLIVGICLYKTKSNTVWLPVADSQQMCVVVSDWWSLKVQAFYPVWRKPTGEASEYSEQWCIMYPDNTWRVFYDVRGRLPAYKYPPVVYSTYF